MRKALITVIVVFAASLTAFSAAKGPDIRIIDNMVSIQADTVPLSRLLRLLDQATGFTSKVPPELANRNVSVRFSNLNLEDAVRKIFEGLPLDYIVILGKGIVVTAPSQSIAAASTGPAQFSAPPPQQETFDDVPSFVPPQMPLNGNPNQPAVIQTPFGPRPNPNVGGNQNLQQGLPSGMGLSGQPGNNGNAPMVAPGQPGNNFFNNNAPFNNSLPGFNNTPGAAPSVSPFGGNPVFPGTTPPGYIPPRPNPR